MRESVGNQNLAVTVICTTAPSPKKVQSKQGQLTVQKLALGNSKEEEDQGNEDLVRGAKLTIEDSKEKGLPLFEPHRIKLIDKC
ncbi:hypothetical protein DFH28DRAFT_980682 [Melampsora americana]|nr:hypothetical protein DFH28DRAFT_980682 [Melampsora americana]